MLLQNFEVINDAAVAVINDAGYMDPGVRCHRMKANPTGYIWSKSLTKMKMLLQCCGYFAAIRYATTGDHKVARAASCLFAATLQLLSAATCS